jgi:tetratricopeptide (TPR) repeat protein
MNQGKCPECGRRKGKRLCKKRGNQAICSLCCPDLRSDECAGCSHYETAAAYRAEKNSAPKKRAKHFTIEQDEEVEGLVDRALALVEQGKTKEAAVSLGELIRQHPRNHMVHFGCGVVAVQEKRFEDALKHFDRAIEIFPYFTAALFNKAMAQQQMGDYTSMIRSLRETVASGFDEDIVKTAKERLSEIERIISQNNGLTLNAYLEAADLFNNGFSYLEKRDWKTAAGQFRKVLEIDPGHVQSWGNLGLAHANMGEKEKAIACLDKALSLDPSYEPARKNRLLAERAKEGEPIKATYQVVEFYKEEHERGKGSI